MPRAKYPANALVATVFSAWMFCLVATGLKAETCGSIEADARQRLVSYIAKKYKLPPQLTIRLEENGFIGDSCYRKVRFFSVASAQFFDLSATLAPDQVFLVTGLDDSRVDPVLVQKKVEPPVTTTWLGEIHRRRARRTPARSSSYFPILSARIAKARFRCLKTP